MGRVVGEARQSRGKMRDMSPKGQRSLGAGPALAASSRLTPVALVIEGKQEGNLLIG